MHLTTDYPWYFILFCIMAGAVYAFLLYYKQQEDKRLRRWLAALRFVSITAIAFLLLAPLFKHQRHQKEKPIIILAQDNSQSVAMRSNNASVYASEIKALLKDLRKDYDVQTYTYGSQLSQCDTTSNTERATDMSMALSELRQRYEGRNVGAMIMSGDGLYNAGQNPVSTATLPYPLYTIVLGDTTPQRDAAIAHLRYNRVAYLGNDFPVSFQIRASRLSGQHARIAIRHKGRELYSDHADYEQEESVRDINITLPADEAGLQTYTISLTSVKGEASTQNNTASFTVEVIDGHQKIALLSAAPHPDIAALCRSIETSPNYTVNCFTNGEWRKTQHDWKKEYDLLILHNLPQRGTSLDMDITQIPTIMIVGAQTDLSHFNSLKCGVEIDTKLDKQNECEPVANGSFANFTLEYFSPDGLPPLSSPFGDYRSAANTASLLYARVGNIATEQPLIAFSQRQGIRRAMVFGEGLWRWRLHDYREHNNFDGFDELINKMVVYTALNINKERLHTECKHIYGDNEAVVIDATFYNDNFEPTNQPDAKIEINGAEYQFAKSGNGYRLNLGMMDTGIYHYTARVFFAGQHFASKGTFVVESQNLESNSLMANHSLMNSLAQHNGGIMLYPDQIGQLPELLRQNGNIKPVIYTHTTYSELINLPLLFILIILLLTVEWVARKYNGVL